MLSKDFPETRMARGWESKSVEDQIADAEARRKASPSTGQPPPADREREARKMALMLSRSRVLHDLQAACHPNHRVTLERSLEFIDNELRKIGN
jgi:hypothetical protein